MTGAGWLRSVAAVGLFFGGGCGGGDSGGSSSAGMLTVKAVWEQPVRIAASALPDDGFGEVIPESVLAVRFIIRNDVDGSRCCLAVVREGDTFARRSFVLTGLADGPTTLRADAYPVRAAPADGITSTCSTDPPDVGRACTAEPDLLPSFVSLPLTATVLPNQRSDAGRFRFLSVPFLLDRDPAPRSQAPGPRPRIALTVVDAVHGITSDLAVRLRLPDPDPDSDRVLEVLPDRFERCDDRGAGPPCSEGGSLGVSGVLFEGRTPADDPVPPRRAMVEVEVGNGAEPPRSLFESYAITVTSPVTTTLPTTTSTTLPPTTSTTLGPPTTTSTTLVTVTTTTSEPTTTSTTLETTTTTTVEPTTTTTTVTLTSTTTVQPTTTVSVTTTTLPVVFHCAVRFAVPETASLGSLNFRINYPDAPGEIVGIGLATSCRSLVAVDSSTLKNSDAKRLLVTLASTSGFAVPADVVECDFEGPSVPSAGQFVPSSVIATRPDSTAVSVSVLVSAITCIPAGSPM